MSQTPKKGFTLNLFSFSQKKYLLLYDAVIDSKYLKNCLYSPFIKNMHTKMKFVQKTTEQKCHINFYIFFLIIQVYLKVFFKIKLSFCVWSYFWNKYYERYKSGYQLFIKYMWVFRKRWKSKNETETTICHWENAKKFVARFVFCI